MCNGIAQLRGTTGGRSCSLPTEENRNKTKTNPLDKFPQGRQRAYGGHVLKGSGSGDGKHKNMSMSKMGEKEVGGMAEGKSGPETQTQTPEEGNNFRPAEEKIELNGEGRNGNRSRKTRHRDDITELRG